MLDLKHFSSFQKFKIIDRKIKREREFLDTYDTFIADVDNFKKELIVKYANENNYGAKTKIAKG